MGGDPRRTNKSIAKLLDAASLDLERGPSPARRTSERPRRQPPAASRREDPRRRAPASRAAQYPGPRYRDPHRRSSRWGAACAARRRSMARATSAIRGALGVCDCVPLQPQPDSEARGSSADARGVDRAARGRPHRALRHVAARWPERAQVRVATDEEYESRCAAILGRRTSSSSACHAPTTSASERRSRRTRWRGSRAMRRSRRDGTESGRRSWRVE